VGTVVFVAAAVPTGPLVLPQTFSYTVELNAIGNRRARRQAQFPFAVAAGTGQVRTTQQLDFETQSSWPLRVAAVSGGVVVAVVNVSVDVVGVACPAGTFSATGTAPCSQSTPCPPQQVETAAATPTADRQCSDGPNIDVSASASDSSNDNAATSASIVGVVALFALLLLLLLGVVRRKRHSKKDCQEEPMSDTLARSVTATSLASVANTTCSQFSTAEKQHATSPDSEEYYEVPTAVNENVYDVSHPNDDYEEHVMYDSARSKSYDTALNTAADYRDDATAIAVDPDYDNLPANALPVYDAAQVTSAADYDVAANQVYTTLPGAVDSAGASYDMAATEQLPEYASVDMLDAHHAGDVLQRSNVEQTYDLGDVGDTEPVVTLRRDEATYDLGETGDTPSPRSPTYDLGDADNSIASPLRASHEFFIASPSNSLRLESVHRDNPLYLKTFADFVQADESPG
jgi:MYXO-CTERM domain-containing protein